MDKIDGSLRFKALIMTLGLTIVLGLLFTEIFSLVAKEKVLQSQFAINLKKHKQGWRIYSYHVEVSFLEPTIDNETFINPHHVIVECG